MNEYATENRNGAGLTADTARDRLLAGVPVVERRLELAGISTSVLDGGTGLPVVLLHGPGEYAAHWFSTLDDLVKTHRVIAPDLPGHGRSAGAESARDATRVLAWLAELVAQTCDSAPVLVGHLTGGAIAARFAIAHPEHVSRLVLVDSLGLVPFQPARHFHAALMQFMTDPTPSTHEQLWRGCAFDLNRLRDELGDRWEALEAYNLDRAADSNSRTAQQGLIEHFGLAPIPADDLARLAVPTTLIWGRHDLATSVDAAREVSGRYGWPLHIIDDAADDPALEQPKAFATALRQTLPT